MMNSILKITRLTLALLLFNFTLTAQTEKDTISKERIFKLGEVVVFSKTNQDKVLADDFKKFNKVDVSSSLNILPSVVLGNSGARNETTVYLRGFDIRSVPIYIDGVPIYVPYDGYVDLSRFTTADLSKIEVSKGYSSILYGPNAIGGTINMISTKPQSAFDLIAKARILSGNGFNNYVSIGTRQNKYYAQGIFTMLNRDYLPLSHDFETNDAETDLKRNNSYKKDQKFTAKFGYTPNTTDEYSISYIKQNGEKGNPVYNGTDTNIKKRYWKWPYWNKESLYFISKTQLTEKTYLKTRAFLDNFKNKLTAFDNDSYSTQITRSSFTSFYNDKTFGANVETGSEFTNNTLKTAIHYKNDHHNAFNEGDNPENMKDDTYSFGIENIYHGINDLKIISGASFNVRNSIMADDTKIINPDGSYGLFPENDNNALNAQIMAQYGINENLNLSFTTAYKTRFATMKDRYSYKMGTAIPNPDLKSEEALQFELASNYQLGKKIIVTPELFYNKISNTIQLVDDAEPGISQMKNTGKSKFYGADLSISFKPFEMVDFMLNYSFIKRENISNPEIIFTDVPENHVFAALEFEFLKGLNFNINGEYSTKRYSTSYGIESPEFTVFNSQISYQCKNGISIETGMNNIFDKNYTLSEGYPEAGRNYYFSLYYKFSSK